MGTIPPIQEGKAQTVKSEPLNQPANQPIDVTEMAEVNEESYSADFDKAINDARKIVANYYTSEDHW